MAAIDSSVRAWRRPLSWKSDVVQLFLMLGMGAMALRLAREAESLVAANATGWPALAVLVAVALLAAGSLLGLVRRARQSRRTRAMARRFALRPIDAPGSGLAGRARPARTRHSAPAPIPTSPATREHDRLAQLQRAHREAERRIAVLTGKIDQAERRRGEMLSMLAHELRNPLAPILAALESLARAADDPASLARARTILERQVGTMTRLIDDLLQVARFTQQRIALQRAPVRLDAILALAREAVEPHFRAKDQVLDCATPTEWPWVDADPLRLAQAVAIVLDNASKFSPVGASVRVRVRCAGAGVSVAVEDDGIGIEAGMLECVFDLFSQADTSLDRSQGGLGVGLTLARQLVRLHAGEIEAASPGLGRGSSFTLHLPWRRAPAAPAALAALAALDASAASIASIASGVAPQPAAHPVPRHPHGAAPPFTAFTTRTGMAASAADPARPVAGTAGAWSSPADSTAAADPPARGRAQGTTGSGSRLRVLVVDDNADAAEALSILLVMLGHEVEVRHDGLQAVEAALQLQPDVVLLDIGLPGLDGYEAAQRIRGQMGGAAMVLVALTGYGQSDDRQRSRAAGFDQHLVKSIAPARLEQVLDAARTRRDS